MSNDQFIDKKINELPEGWRILEFEKAIKNKRIKVGKVQKREYKSYGKYPIIDQSQEFIAGYWDEESDIFKDELPIIIFGDHTRIFKYIDFHFVCGADGAKIIIPNKKIVNPLFFYYSLLNLSIRNRGYNRHYTLLKQKKIAIPIIDDQKRIAKILHSVENSIGKAKNLILTIKNLKKSLISYLFKYGATPLSEKNKITLIDTEIGRIPETWKVKKLEEIADINSTNRNPSKEYPDDHFTYIDISSIEGETGRILENKQILGKDAPSRARRLIHINDVLLSTVRPYLKAFAIIPEEYNNQICSTGFAVLTSKRKILLPKYLLYVLFSDLIGNQFKSLMRGSNYPALNDGHVKNTKIPVAPIEEQKRIINILSSLDKKLYAEENRKEGLEKLFISLLKNQLFKIQ